MSDSFTETTSESWGSRLMSAIGGVLVGIVLFLVSFPLLFWNEGRAVRTAQSLEEGASNVVSVPPGVILNTVPHPTMLPTAQAGALLAPPLTVVL